jgi:chromosome segregation ATPase
MEVNEKETTADELVLLVDQYKRWWMDETNKTGKLEKKVEEMQKRIDELEDTVNFRAATIEELEIVNETLREKSAKLFGEVCGLKFAIRCLEMFNDYIPEEGETA